MNVFDLFAKLSLDKSEYDNGLNDAEKEATSFGGKLKSGLGTAAKIGVGAMTALGTAAGVAGTALVNGTKETAAYGDNIDKMSQKMGISAQAYQEWDAVLQHSGTSIDSMSRGMQTLQKNAVNSAEKFEALGITQEQLANMSTEELFAATISGLQDMGEGAERTALASELLGGSAKELGALLNTSSEDTQAMIDRVHELGGVMSDDAVKAAAGFQDSLQDMNTAMDGLKRNMLGEFMPGMTTVMDGLTEIFSGNYDEGLDKISEGIDNVVSNLTEMLPKILEIGVKIIEALAKSLVQNLPKILPGLITIVTQVATMIVDNLDIIIDALVAALPILIQGCITLVIELTKHLPEIIMALIDAIPEIIMAIIEGFTPLVTDLAALASQCIDGIVAWFSELPGKLAEWVTNAANKVKAIFTNMWDGIKNIFSKVGDFFKNAFTKAWTNIKNVFSSWGSFFGNLWNTIADKFKAIGTKIGDAISGAVKSGINGVISAIETIINKGIGLINGAIKLINKIPGVNVGYLEDLELPKLAKGGVVDRPTIAEIGEQGREAIVPLENNTEWIKKLAKELGSVLGTNNGQPVVVQSHIYLEGDAKSVWRIVKEQNDINTKATRTNALATL